MSRKRKDLLFLEHVQRFMKEAKLFPPSGKAFVAVSGGRDSVALLFCLKEFYQQGLFKELVVLHVNHGTRPQNSLEADWVRELSSQWQLKYKEKTFSHWKGDQKRISNFEHRAREGRYDFFLQEAGLKDRVYTAHHIDDSFEWSLLQQLRSSARLSTLGIPVLHGSVARPFLSVTREQIQNFVKELDLGHWEDPSNQDCHFDRNFLRHKVLATIGKRFPSFLKHYVYRSNDLAKLWGKSAFSQLPPSPMVNEQNLGPYRHFRDPVGVQGFFHWEGKKEFGPLEEKICSLIHSLSLGDRGVLRLQVKKLIQASQTGKWGPMFFSGGVFGFMMPGIVGLVSSSLCQKYKVLDEECYQKLLCIGDLQKKFPQIEMTFSQFTKQWGIKLQSSQEHQWNDYFPFWVLSYDEKNLHSLLPSLKKAYPLWPKTTAFFVENKIWFRSAGEIYSQWKKLREKNKNYTFNLSF